MSNTNGTNFEKVVDFNKQFGVKVHDSPQPKIFDADPDLVKLRLSLIQEEVKELEQAIKDKDMVETVDALADILYVVYGAGASFGTDLDHAFNLVHESNMSKACVDEETAKATVDWYNERKVETGYDSPAYRKEGDRWVVFNESTGKVLKSIKYHPVDLAEFGVEKTES